MEQDRWLLARAKTTAMHAEQEALAAAFFLVKSAATATASTPSGYAGVSVVLRPQPVAAAPVVLLVEPAAPAPVVLPARFASTVGAALVAVRGRQTQHVEQASALAR